MHWHGLAVGAAAFLIIGMFHPIVIYCEYHFSQRIWPMFLLLGAVFCAASALVGHALLSAVLGILGFTFLWSILELKHQAERVRKGWFPENPKRRAASSEGGARCG